MIEWDAVRREPYRALFPLSLLVGLIGVNHWLWYALGWTPRYSGGYHAALQLQGYVFGFILGFLLTAVPRFASAPPATTAELATILGVFLLQPVLLWFKQWAAAAACYAVLLAALILFAGRRFGSRRSPAGPPVEFVWLPIGLVYGIVGAGLFIIAQWYPIPWLVRMAQPLAQQGAVLGIVIGVASFMGPRLMGRSLGTVTDLNVREGRRSVAVPDLRRRWHLAAALLFGLSFVVEGAGLTQAAYLLRALIVTAVFTLTAKFHQPPQTGELYVTLLWLSLWLVAAGLWGVAILPARRVMMLHLVFLGGFSLMVFAVSTMVVHSHAGEAARLRQPSWPLRLMGAGVVAGLLARLIAEAFPAQFFLWLAIASACWDVAALSWFSMALPRILRTAPEGAFERVHEDAKRRLLRTVC